MSVFYRDPDTAQELRQEALAARRAEARRRCWCSECHGFDGEGSPCHIPEPDQPEEDA